MWDQPMRRQQPDGVEGCAAVAAGDQGFRHIQRQRYQAAEDQETLRGADLRPAGAGESELAGGDEAARPRTNQRRVRPMGRYRRERRA